MLDLQQAVVPNHVNLSTDCHIGIGGADFKASYASLREVGLLCNRALQHSTPSFNNSKPSFKSSMDISDLNAAGDSGPEVDVG